MRKKSDFEKITDVILVGSLVGISFMIGFKLGTKHVEKRGAAL